MDIRAELIEIANLPNLKVSDGWRRQIIEFVEVNECRLALDTIGDWIVEYEVKIDQKVFQKLVLLREKLGEPRDEEYIKRNLLKSE